MAAKQKQDNFIRNALFIGLGSWLLLKNIVPIFKVQSTHASANGSNDDMIAPPYFSPEETAERSYYPDNPYPLPPENDGNDGNNDEGKMQIEPPLPLPELGPPLSDPPTPLPIKPPIPMPIVKKKVASSSIKGIFMDMLDEFELGDRTWFYSSQDMIDGERPFPERMAHVSSCCNFIPTRKKRAEEPTEKIYY